MRDARRRRDTPAPPATSHGRRRPYTWPSALSRRQPPRKRTIGRYTGVLLAIATGIVHLGVAPVFVVNGVRPNLALVAVVLATALFGFQHGMLWAFVTGLTVNLLGFDPLGSVPLALLVVSAVVAGGDRLFGRLAWVFPIAAALVGSALYDLVLLVVFALLGQGLDLERSVSVVAAAAALNAVLAGVLLVPARLVAARISEQQNPTW